MKRIYILKTISLHPIRGFTGSIQTWVSYSGWGGVLELKVRAKPIAIVSVVRQLSEARELNVINSLRAGNGRQDGGNLEPGPDGAGRVGDFFSTSRIELRSNQPITVE